MAVIKDLTWQQLKDALDSLGYTGAVVLSNGKVILDVGVLTGEVVDGLADTGVAEAIFKIRQGAGVAQSTVNETVGLLPEERLTAFPGFAYSQPDENGNVGVTQVSTFIIPLATSVIFGTN